MQMHIDKYERMWLTAVVVVLGIFFASLVAGVAIFGVRPAAQAGVINPMYLEQSEFASENLGVRHMGGNQYEARILAQKWAFVPAEITVPEGAEVTFIVTSRDVTHGFMVEHTTVNMELVPGHISQARTTFHHPGEFKILCHEYCGRGHQLMHSTIIVEDVINTALNEE